MNTITHITYGVNDCKRLRIPITVGSIAHYETAFML